MVVRKARSASSPSSSGRWARARGPILGVSGLAALATCATAGSVPGDDLGSLAIALGRAAHGARVDPRDLRWEPSGGAAVDLTVGRWALYLARSAEDEPRDVWRARVRIAADGRALQVAEAHDLTNTPLGDDHELVVRGTHAAFATSAYGQEQSVTILDLAGEGDHNKTTGWLDRAMAAVTNELKTGSAGGIGRVVVTFDPPGKAVGLALDDEGLDIRWIGGDGRRGPPGISGRMAFARGDLVAPTPAMHAEPSIHLPKRLSHWAVDTLRAVPWIGPAPIAWAEDQALAARDAYRRLTFSSDGLSTGVIAPEAPPPPVLDTSQASVEEAHWPPPPVATIWKSPEKGEGEWVVPALPWLRRVPGVLGDAPSPFYQTFVRPDEERPYVKVLLVAMDMRQLDLDMEAGVEDPEPLTGPPGAGRIPRDPAVYRRVAAAFNGAFKTDHGHYGMMVHKRVLLPPVPAAATVAVFDDGRIGFGTWGADRRVTGLGDVSEAPVASFRQNLDALVDHGRINPTGRNLWGFTLPGKGAQTERTGLCVTESGHLLYAWGEDLSGTTLAKAMSMAGCDYALHLDMNPYHTGFIFTAIDDLSTRKVRSALLTPAMSIPADRFVQFSPKDFFYVLVHDPTPPSFAAGSSWVADGGLQPPPHWLPGLWASRIEGADRTVDLLDVERGRVTWRVRAGAKDASAASVLREIEGEPATRVLLAAGLGAAPDKRPLGLAIDGRIAVAMRGDPDLATAIVSADGALTLERAPLISALGSHDDWVELPVLLWEGQRFSEGRAPLVPLARAALGLTGAGRVVIARGVLTSNVPLADALAAVGCTRAVLLDRGRASGSVDRAGTSAAPRARYDESVLYAMGVPFTPRAFRFEMPTTVAQAGRLP